MTPRSLALQSGALYYKGSDCKQHGAVMRYTKNGTCVVCQKERHKLYMRGNEEQYAKHRDYMYESGLQEFPAAYHNGRRYRSKNRPKQPPFHLPPVEKYWWLAGWNDRDRQILDKR